MASWSDIEPEEAALSPEEKKRRERDLSLELSSREDEFRLIHLKKCFNVCDKDSDGFIDSRELRQLCVTLDLPQFASGDSAAALFRALDVNSSGKIAFRDFLRYKDIYLKSAQSVVLDTTGGSLSPSSTVTSSSYQEAVSVDSELETGHTTFESPGRDIRFPPRTDSRRVLETSDSSGSPDHLETGTAPSKVEKRRIRPSSAGLTGSDSSRRNTRPSSAETKDSDIAISKPNYLLRAKSYTSLSSARLKEEGLKSVNNRKRSSSSGYIHQLLSLHQPIPVEDSTDRTDTDQEAFTGSTPTRGQSSRSRRQFYPFDSPVIKPALVPSSLPLEALPSSPVTVLHSICEEGSDHVSMSELMELFQVLGFDRNDVSEDMERVLQEVPRDGEGGLSVIGVALAIERILAGEEEVHEGSLLRQLSLKMYQQEIVVWRTNYQTSVNERDQLLDTLEYHRGEQRRLLVWGDEQAEIEALHWDKKLRDRENELRSKLRYLESNKKDEMENIIEKTAREIEEREKSIKRLQRECEHLRELVRDLKTDKDYLTHDLEDSKNKLSLSERIIDSLQLQLQEYQGLSQLSDPSRDTDKNMSDLDRVIEERNQLLESNKTLQDSNDEITAENQKIQQQLRMTQNRYKQAVKALGGRPVSGKTRASPLIPRSRHSKSLVEPPQLGAEGEDSPGTERKANLMGEMIDHDLQTMEKKRMIHLEDLNSKLEQRLEELEASIRQTDSKLFETERERDRERQKRKKEDKANNAKIAELESENVNLRELKSSVEEKLEQVQLDVVMKFTEIARINKELVTLTHKLAETDLNNDHLLSLNKDLEATVKSSDVRDKNVAIELASLKNEVHNLQFELSSSKSKYELRLGELERLLSEAEEAAIQDSGRLKLQEENENKRMKEYVQNSNQVMEKLRDKIQGLENDIAEIVKKHKIEVESLSEEIRKGVEREEGIREAKLAVELKLRESLAELCEVVKSRDLGDTSRAELAESLNRIKTERDITEKELKAKIASLNEKLESTHGELSIKLIESQASHKQALTEVRSEYESQIEKLQRELKETATTTETRSQQEIAELTKQVDRYTREVEALREAAKCNEELQREFETVWRELEGLKAEKDRESEAHFDQICDFKENIESLEEKLREVTLQAELEQSELDESIKGYEEHERVLIEESELRISQLKAKFKQEMADRSLDEENNIAEIERLMLQLSEKEEEIELIREDNLKQIQVLRNDGLATVSSLNELKKSKEVEITQIRNTLFEHESRMRFLEKANETSKLEVLSRNRELDNASSELESNRRARKLLEMQLDYNHRELEVSKRAQVRIRAELEERVREQENRLREVERDRDGRLEDLESRCSAQVRELKLEVERRGAEIRQLKMRLIEAVSIQAGEELNAEWKTHIQELSSQISELERQLRSRDTILEQVRKERRETQEFKSRIVQLLEEKEELICIIEKLSYLIAENC